MADALAPERDQISELPPVPTGVHPWVAQWQNRIGFGVSIFPQPPDWREFIRLVQRMLEAVVSRGRHAHAAHGGAPFFTGDHGTAVRAEADEHDIILVVRLPYELADVEHAGAGHVGESRVADVCVVLPHDRLRVRTMVLHEPLERLDHVRVANVPRGRAAADHRAVIALRVPGDERILLRVEERVAAILAEHLGLVADGREDGNRFALAGRRDERGRAYGNRGGGGAIAA